MKNKFICVFILIIVFVAMLSGCNNNNEEIGPFEERNPMIQLGYKGNSLEYEINDVTLTFFVGSENAGELDDQNSPQEYPLVAYIYFANEQVLNAQYVSGNKDLGYLLCGVGRNELSFNYPEGYGINDPYGNIETNTNIHIVKKLFNSNEDSFYKNNTVSYLYGDTKYSDGKYAAEELWGGESILYKITTSYSNGIFLPTLSYELTIPESFFISDSGYVFIGATSYFIEDYDMADGSIAKQGSVYENRVLPIYYQKNGSTIILSGYYAKEK